MERQMAAVKAFHDKMNISRPAPWSIGPDELVHIGEFLMGTSRNIELVHPLSDVRFLRAHLMLEELGEYLTATTEAEALDALTDLLYVVIGTAVQHEWPFSEAFDEVHRANMTKERQAGDPGRVRQKGGSFVPPNIARLLHKD